MGRALRTLLGTLALVALAVVVVIGVIKTAGPVGGGVSAAADPTTAGPPQDALTVQQAGRAFLDGYVDPDGRVVRRDQGGDTVSEGQAYGLLVAVGLGDRGTFVRIWDWTRANLLRADDGLLSWHWQDGRVADGSPASDADLDAARALVLAGERFSDPTLTSAGVDLGTAVLDHETVTTDLGRVLVAGDWATAQEPYAYNPSYASPVALDVMAKASDDPRWAELATGDRAAVEAVLEASDLPPDWAQIHTDGTVDPMPGAQGRGNDGVRYSYDATRTPIRFAESCTDTDVALAARMKPAIDRFPGGAASRDLGGQPLGTDTSVVAIVANAAIMAAAGDDDAAVAALGDADRLQQQSPTYYGGAWDALGRLMLTSDALGSCPQVSR